MTENVWKILSVCLYCAVFCMQCSYASDSESATEEQEDNEDEEYNNDAKRIYDPEEREQARNYVRSVLNKLLKKNVSSKSNPIQGILSSVTESKRVSEQKKKLIQARAIIDHLIANLGNYGKHEVDELRKDINACIDKFEQELKELNGTDESLDGVSDKRKKDNYYDDEDTDEEGETNRSSRKKREIDGKDRKYDDEDDPVSGKRYNKSRKKNKVAFKKSKFTRNASARASKSRRRSYTAKPYGKFSRKKIHTVKNVPIMGDSNSYLDRIKRSSSGQTLYKVKYFGNQTQTNTTKPSVKREQYSVKQCCACCAKCQ